MTIGLRGFSPLLLIQAGMAPLTAYLFNYFSVASFFLNLPIIAISGVIIPLGIGMIPVSFLGGPVFGVSAQAAELLIRIMLWLNELFYLPGLGFFNVVSPTVWFLLIFYGLFFFLTSEGFRILYQRRKGKAIAVCFVLILTVSLLASEAAGDGGPRDGLVFVDVGQGDCLHIRTPSGKNILIDGGGSVNYEVGKKLLLPYFLKNGVKSVDLAIATHLHTDHYRGIAELARNMEIGRLGVYEANRLREQELLADTGLSSGDLLYLTEGDRISIEKDVWIDVLYPEKRSAEEYESLILNEEDENRNCLFMRLFYQGLTVIITGDIGMEGEQEIMERYRDELGVLEADVLKIGHHGSRFSTGDRFLDLVDPKIAVFQVGKNNFGHPHPSVIEKCQEKGIIIYRNDLNGAIIFEKEEQVWHTKVLLRKNMHIEE
jgi:competence protein ComEC